MNDGTTGPGYLTGSADRRQAEVALRFVEAF
jgi:hypothetical protein